MEPGGSCLGQEWDHSALGFAFDEVCWCESDFSSNRHEVMSPTLKMCFFLQRAESLAGGTHVYLSSFHKQFVLLV